VGKLSVLEICAGAGGQAIGLERAGFSCIAAIDNDAHAIATLRQNRPEWNVIHADVRFFDVSQYVDKVDLFAGGVPCPPFSKAGKQLGDSDERDLFPVALRMIREIRPSAIILENVPGFAEAKFENYRNYVLQEIERLGFDVSWRILFASDFGLPQLRPRFVLTALRSEQRQTFALPNITPTINSVGSALFDLMAANGWRGAEEWAIKANSIAPTLVGGSKKHGGPDLGPTRAKRPWLKLGIDGRGIADESPNANQSSNFLPRLTLRMVARLQGFPDTWNFCGGKTAAYRQIGNAFPPPVSEYVGKAIHKALSHETEKNRLKGSSA
jgi:DNA (cytosine-5)-methyltransferase 1